MLIQGDARHIPLKDESVQCVVTSPPYYGLRDYKVDGQIGLEQTPEEYVAKLVEVFREVKRVLRKDGTVWLNLGDSFWGGKGQSAHGDAERHIKRLAEGKTINHPYQEIGAPGVTAPKDGKHETIKPKDLIGIPWRVAFALQADGWWLRQDIIWAKPNPMPESATDRCTKSHEYLFLLTKSAHYFYDNIAILEPAAYDGRNDTNYKGGNKDVSILDHERWPHNLETGSTGELHSGYENPDGSLRVQEKDGVPARNKRDVWTIPTYSYPGAHYATFPPALVEPCILAGTSAKGCCPKCGAPWTRIVNHVNADIKLSQRAIDKRAIGLSTALHGTQISPPQNETVGWQPTRKCDADDPIPCTVFDPFGGTATVGEVSLKFGRRYVGLDLNAKYMPLAQKRLQCQRGFAELFTLPVEVESERA